MNFEDEEEDPLTYKSPELRAKIEEVLSNLPALHIDESDTSDEPVRRLTVAEMRASCTSLFSNSASSSRDMKSEKKDDKNIMDEPFFQAPDNLDEILDAELDSQLTNEECSAAKGDGHQCELNRDSITFSQINKIMSVSCGEQLPPITGEGIVLEEGDCGIRKLATSSGSRPEMSDNAWKRASASTSNCVRPATVPKARARRSETASVMTTTDQSRELIGGQQKPKAIKSEEDESDDSDDGSWWEEHDKGAVGGSCPIPKRRTLLDKGPNVDITRQRSILDLCSVQHGETVENIECQEAVEQKCQAEITENLEAIEPQRLGDTVYAENLKEDGGAIGGGDGIVGIHEDDARVIENGDIETVRSDAWDWVSSIPRACFMDDIEQGESYLPLISSLRDDDIDPRLLQHKLRVARNEWK
uniref:Uncharacterized protein n=1 Tax=Strigamia maritima TaxID=126957 RepID=T1IWA9_STRMM